MRLIRARSLGLIRVFHRFTHMVFRGVRNPGRHSFVLVVNLDAVIGRRQILTLLGLGGIGGLFDLGRLGGLGGVLWADLFRYRDHHLCRGR